MFPWLFVHALAVLIALIGTQDFKSEQMRYPRVRAAYQEKEALLATELERLGVPTDKMRLFIRAFKKEQVVETWVANETSPFMLFRSYRFCETSGTYGPKRRQGDGQIPEGFYRVDRFNPTSNFHLSLGIDYPNALDKALATGPPGGDIFIHGACVTIGCIPLTDDKIREVYIPAVEARSNGQQHIPVHIFPCRMNEATLNALAENTKASEPLRLFWNDLQTGYAHFETTRTVPKFAVVEKRYVIR